MMLSLLKSVGVIAKHAAWWNAYEIRLYWSTREIPKVTPKWSFKYNPEENKEKTDKKVSSGPMPIFEAIQILQVPNEFNIDQVEEKYNKLLKINDPNKGGSFYIQCKITGARQTLIQALIPPEISKEVEKLNKEKKL
ncbi:hypothetical protein SteCoe_4223 [Stentor coeruleus]|uniref:Mitochondrial import inner membrane translocase subunit TIM16 n=1 Tax=Stentor coeruleus TaxID=5963 RepID=A0A1R2CV90_9CILI|nr:hypothetical protein SteCoe_4223 [Stentor coeruleus]